MCGIAGFYNIDGAPADASILRRMTDVQRHRGPDDQGFRLFSLAKGTSLEFSPGAPPAPSSQFEGGLGFNRLSILDLSIRGHQPMANESETVFIVFNGEIYNANDHRPSLQAHGYRFRSGTDTEVILHLYEEYGIDGCLERLNGMFAFAIVDLRSGEMHIARDHFGVKPMYYARHRNTLLFASEAKAIIAWPGFPREIDPAMLDEFLLFRYNVGEGFLLRGIKQLRPGHRLCLTSNGHVQLHRYYAIPDATPEAMTDAEAIEQFERTFAAGVKRQLISDRKVGLQLSGGIDSSLIAYMARLEHAQDLESFSVTLDDPELNETQWINIVAPLTRTIAHSYKLDSAYFLDNLARASWHYDSPINIANSVALYLLSERAAQHVAVVLTGDGADEMLGGYRRFVMAAMRPFVQPVMPLLSVVPRLGQKLSRNFNMPPGLDHERWFITSTSAMRNWQVQQLRHEADISGPIESRLQLFREGQASYLDNCIKYEMQSFMVELLIRQDKMTMAHSLESRVPFLDRETAHLSARLPQRLKITLQARKDIFERGGKTVLKALAEKRFGETFAYRRKNGFTLPLGLFFETQRFKELWEDNLLPGITRRGWVDGAVAAGWLEDLTSTLPQRNDAQNVWLTEAFWSVVALESWAQAFVDVNDITTGIPPRFAK